MGFEVAEEPLERVRQETLTLLSETRGYESDDARFDWMYLRNPDGPAVLWTVRETESGQLAGYTVCLPRTMWVDGEPKLAWIGADFSMDPKFRTLGPAIKLRRAARQAIDAGRADFLYAHPNERMAVIHRQVGHKPVGQMIRFSRILKSKQHLTERLGRPFLAGIAGSVLDLVIRLSGRERRVKSTCQISPISTIKFDHRADELFERVAPRKGVIGVRDAAYLNWRYGDCPLYQTEGLIAEKEGALQGYLLYKKKEGHAHIHDVFPPQDPQVAGELIAAMIKRAYQDGLGSVSFVNLESNPLIEVLQSFGFGPRSDRSEMFGYSPENSEKPLSDYVTDRKNWFLTVGDRDM